MFLEKIEPGGLGDTKPKPENKCTNTHAARIPIVDVGAIRTTKIGTICDIRVAPETVLKKVASRTVLIQVNPGPSSNRWPPGPP